MASEPRISDGKVFQFVVVLHPTINEREDGRTPKIIVDATTVWAPSREVAVSIAGRSIPEEHLDRLERVEIVVRDF